MLHNDSFALGLALALSLATTSCAGARSDPPVKVDGDRLTGSNGMTLYTFDKDAVGAESSACDDGCAKNWPPLLAGPSASAQGDFGLVSRGEGLQQWAYKGKPLYFWVKDASPGDTSGDGVKGVWHIARP